MKVIPETHRAHYIWYLTLYYYQWVDTSNGVILVPEVIIRPVVSASALIWVIEYIYYWSLQFLNNVIINKTMVLLSEAYVTVEDFDYSD
jgi:hypothetical protein